jgi:hypothetical protein
MLTKDNAHSLAVHWIGAWNSHNLDEIMSHYADDVVLVSPVAAKLLDDPSGTVRGKEFLRAYFRKGLEAYPQLRFELLDLMWGLSTVVLCYMNQNGTKTAEFMEIDSTGQIIRVVANYSG